MTAARVRQLPVLPLPDGSRVEQDGRGVAICDPDGQVVVRYQDGAATIYAPRGDLTLEAPHGSVRLRAGQDLELECPGTLQQRAGELHRNAEHARDRLGTSTTVARHFEIRATELSHRVERYELQATRVVQRARDAFVDIAEIMHRRVGSMRSVTRDLYHARARRTVIRSSDDTAIDGKRVLLG